MTDRVRVSGRFQATPPTLSDGDAAPFLFDASGKLLVASSGAAETYSTLSSSDVNGGFLVEATGPVRLFSVMGTNGDLFDGTPAYLLLFDVEWTGGIIILPPPTLSFGQDSPIIVGRDVLGDRGWTFTEGCAWAWSTSATSMVPFGGDPSDHHLFAAFQFIAGG